ncbi:MAG: hypothetical protein J5966_10615, partial [Lachnospiraceae bacterium]|nr:hypothetical protein [Lachnospiraceae bacterium]
VTKEETGSVQFVSQSGSKTYLTINGNQYELGEISKVWDDTYATAYNLTDSWSKSLATLPNSSFITANNKDAYQSQVSALYASYMSMDDYSRNFISDEDKTKFGELIAQYRTLGVDIEGSGALAAQAAASASEDEGDPEEAAEELAEEIVQALTETDADSSEDTGSSEVSAETEGGITDEADS